jgi:1,4-alpha-glucan branching enzyme
MEAVVHCYVPLVAMLRRLEAQGRRRILTFSVTPVLAAQLADPRTRIAVDKYYGERLAAAETLQKQHPLGSWWGLEIARSRADWNDISGDLISALRVLEDRGTIELSTCAATHAYLPLTHHTEMIRLQIAAGCRLHEKLFGRWPRGIWMPECAYRPSGPWRHPVTGASEPFRAGNEAFLEEQDLRWTVVDAHLILGGEPFLGYGFPWANDPHAVSEPLPEPEEGGPTLSQQLQPTRIGQSRVAALIREPHTARQVWARHLGYPGDPRFLDFHKRHETSGLRLWSVTDADANLADKLPYWPHAAADAIQDQARHFLDMLQRIPGLGGGVAVCPFDAELFGHWWYEGPQWLEAVFEAAAHESNLETTTPEVEVERIPPHRRHELLEGSWGEEGDHRVWVNPQTEWMWKDLRDAEVAVDRLLADAASSATLCEAALAQLMLMASSDWPFLITMKAAADYATTRFKRHRDRLYSLLNLGTSDPLPDWVDEDLALMDLDRRWWSQERI